MASAALQLDLFSHSMLTAPAAEPAPTQAPSSVGTVAMITVPPANPVPLSPTDFHLAGTRGLAASWEDRARDNIAAIKLLGQIEKANRFATPDEQDRLAKFTAFGAGELANNLFPTRARKLKGAWQSIQNDLNAAITQDERSALMQGTQYAHFTPEWIARAMWSTLTTLGFKGGSVLEPGAGTGLFLATAPRTSTPTRFTAVERDPITARIAGKLFPNQRIIQEDFTTAALPGGFDLAIGNPPFSNRTIKTAGHLGKQGLSLHDYFIARSIAQLRPGGFAMFVTSRWTMDKTDPKARALIADTADFLGAVRLPQKAMAKEAGTDVVVDILLFRKRHAHELAGGPDWFDTADVPHSDVGNGPLHINRYFLDHPNLVLGNHTWGTSQYGPDYSCAPRPNEDLEAALPLLLDWIAQNSGERFPIASNDDDIVDDLSGHPQIQVGTAASGATVKEGSYILHNDELFQIYYGRPEKVKIRSGKGGEGIFPKHAAIISGLIPIRDYIRAIQKAQLANQPYGTLQHLLQRAYDRFTAQFGPINKTSVTVREDPETKTETETHRRVNLQPFLDDPDVWLVAACEDYDVDTDTGTPGAIFTQRILNAPTEPDLRTANDALALSLHETGQVDPQFMASRLGRNISDILDELGDAIFLCPDRSLPGNDVWLTADEMLSGPVRTKLQRARNAALVDERYQRNVDALEQVQPVDLNPSDITARLGAPWIPTGDIEAFVADVMEIKTRVYHTIEIATWSVDKDSFYGDASATSTWGTQRRDAGHLLEDALNQVTPKIYDYDPVRDVRELNVTDTEAAKEKLAAIKAAFEKWIWQDTDRADRLVRCYNDAYNNLVPRKFDGSHLQLPGASTAISMRPHQMNVIWRVVASGKTYIAHSVGAGKTFSLVAAAMEQKRLGLIKKPMITVPGHCLAQIAREFLQLYPQAKILVADETNFVGPKRRHFLARASMENWDAIIITHSAFKFIPTPLAYEKAMIEDQIDSYVDLITSLDSGDRLSRKRLEAMKERMKGKLEALQSRKDDLLHIGEIGVDQIIVDEAQEFRKLHFSTSQSDLKGVDPVGSQRAWDLFVKSSYVETINTGRSLILSSGTPITNTLGEMFTVQRYMDHETLKSRGLHEFDAWSANFGETRTELELQPSGSYKPVTRFSEFVNVADLMAMYRKFADVVQKDDLKDYVKLPAVSTGKRQILVAPSGAPFRAYQKDLAARIKAIETRTGRAQKGDDILLSVITDARHASIDLRFVVPDAVNDNDNKLNLLIQNVYRIWEETKEHRYVEPLSGRPYDLPGAVQMIFSDLGTEAALENRGFSAYSWIRHQLNEMGVPPDQIAFMQHYKTSAAKQRLFGDLNAGRKRILIGSTATMGTGVNAQQRLKALHHLDVPWLLADIDQREGRIERQGNQHDVIDIFAYALKGSVDATSWQLLERKSRFICLAMSGDRTIRRLEDVGSDGNQFAMAKALASGDDRLIKKAGLEADIARLERLRAAHFDDQYAVRRNITFAKNDIDWCGKEIPKLLADIAQRIPTQGDKFVFLDGKKHIAERKKAGEIMLSRMMLASKSGFTGDKLLGSIGGFDLIMHGTTDFSIDRTKSDISLYLAGNGRHISVPMASEPKPVGIISRIENTLNDIERELVRVRARLEAAERRLPGYEARLGQEFTEQQLLEEKLLELAEIEADLAASSASSVNDEYVTEDGEHTDLALVA